MVTGSKRETRLGTGKTERERLFDDWAKHYDSAVGSAASGFPFDGYEQVLDAAVESADAGPDLRVLDLGIGTGNLAARFVRQGCDVWGLDFSAEMLARVRAKWPQVHLIQASLQASLPGRRTRDLRRVAPGWRTPRSSICWCKHGRASVTPMR